MEGFDKVIAFILQYWPLFGAVILELILRLTPSDSARSILSYVGKIMHGIGDVLYAFSDTISKVIPDKPEE